MQNGTLAGVEHRFVEVNGIKLHCAEMGSGPLVVLLHGFPEFWYSWRYQMPALAAAGYRVVAPDMRGYNTSDKPKGVQAYSIDKLTSDVAELIKAYGEKQATVVGHDWGAAVAWTFAMQYPQHLERLIILNVPHPITFLKALKTFRQLRKSWYIFFFQIPWLPERGFRANNYASLRRVFRKDPVRQGAFSEGDIEKYVEAAAQPGALTAAINYYRAMFRSSPSKVNSDLRPITAPTLVIWGEQDNYLGKELADPHPKWVKDVRVERLPDASHWVQCDRPDEVNRLMLDFLRQPVSAG